MTFTQTVDILRESWKSKERSSCEREEQVAPFAQRIVVALGANTTRSFGGVTTSLHVLQHQHCG